VNKATAAASAALINSDALLFGGLWMASRNRELGGGAGQ